MFLILKFRISCKSTRRGVPFYDRDYSKKNFFFLGLVGGGGGGGGAEVATHSMRQLVAIAAAVLGKL